MERSNRCRLLAVNHHHPPHDARKSHSVASSSWSSSSSSSSSSRLLTLLTRFIPAAATASFMLLALAVRFAVMPFPDRHGGALSFELLHQIVAGLQPGELLRGEDFKGVAVDDLDHQVRGAARWEDADVELHEREAEAVDARLPAREIREDEEASESGVGYARGWGVRVCADELTGDEAAGQTTAHLFRIVRISRLGDVGARAVDERAMEDVEVCFQRVHVRCRGGIEIVQR